MSYRTRIEQFLKTATARLALSYLAIIMLMSIGFSLVFYNTSSRALGRQIPPPGVLNQRILTGFVSPKQTIEDFFRERIKEGRRELMTRLIGLNVLILVGGSAVSYYLARRTLKPIEANMEAQSQFVGDASHELRTPLTALQTINEVALRKSKVSSAEANDIFKHNVDEVMKLRRLTDSLLNLARSNGSLLLTSVDISEMVSDALNTVVNSAVEKQIEVEDKVPKIVVIGDKGSLTQALVTILDNAIKYSHTKSKIYISASKDNVYAYINVKDEGIGIKAIHLPHIFERFYRADASRSKQENEGFGIGLALAKKIIDQHHGEIIAQSAPGKGSVFTIKLPLS